MRARAEQSRSSSTRARACDWLLLAGVVASALGRAHPGGDDNVRLPAYAMLVWVAALGCAELLLARRAWIALSVGLCLQALMLLQAPSLYAPDAASARAFTNLRAELQRVARMATPASRSITPA